MTRVSFAVCICVISVAMAGCDADKIARLEKQNHELEAQIQKQQAAATFDLQERCAEQSRKTFNDLGFKAKDLASYENHYNEKLNKCFIEIRNSTPSSDGRMVVSRNVSDALEGKVFGEYIWQSDKVKKYWEVAPLMCKVTLPSREDRLCKSEDEFKELLKPYLDIS